MLKNCICQYLRLKFFGDFSFAYYFNFVCAPFPPTHSQASKGPSASVSTTMMFVVIGRHCTNVWTLQAGKCSIIEFVNIKDYNFSYVFNFVPPTHRQARDHRQVCRTQPCSLYCIYCILCILYYILQLIVYYYAVCSNWQTQHQRMDTQVCTVCMIYLQSKMIHSCPRFLTSRTKAV